MDRTSIRVAVAATVLLIGGAVQAGEPGAALPHQAEAVPAAGAKFASSPCHAGRDSLQQVELSAFDTWQGARTLPAGNSQALMYGAPPLLPVSASPEQSASAESAAPSFREQRRRLFALGLAVLLNLNQNR